MREIPLTQGKVAIVDDEDFAKLAHHRWHVAPWKHLSYACTNIKRDDGRGYRTIRMHRFIMAVIAQPRVCIDHLNGDGLDNRRINLRICTNRQNSRNKRKRSNTASQYKGVTWSNYHQRWQAYIQVNYKSRHLGYFTEENSAAKAYDRAAIEAFGEFAKVNFPTMEAMECPNTPA